MEINYKAKYQQIKVEFMDAVDVAWRLGFEAGKQQAQLDQAAEQQAQQAQLDSSQSGAPQEQAEEGSPSIGEQEAPGSENPQGSELDQHIAKLESMVSKSETSPEDLKKALDEIRGIRKAQLQQIELKKSSLAIKGISKALHKPAFKLSKQASHNMNDNAKKAVTMQHKIVEDIMKSWSEEESKTSKDVFSALNIEGLTTKE